MALTRLAGGWCGWWNCHGLCGQLAWGVIEFLEVRLAMTSALDRSPSKPLDAKAKVSEAGDESDAAVEKSLGKMEENAVLRRALQHAGKELGLSKQALAQAVGEIPSFFDPGQETSPIAPCTYQRIGLMLRLHDSLSSLVGHNVEHMRGWMGALNWPTGWIPAKQLKDPDQLEKLVSYLEAFDR